MLCIYPPLTSIPTLQEPEVGQGVAAPAFGRGCQTIQVSDARIIEPVQSVTTICLAIISRFVQVDPPSSEYCKLPPSKIIFSFIIELESDRRMVEIRKIENADFEHTIGSP